MMKYNVFVEKLEWLEARRDTLWLDQKTPRWWESSSTTRIKLETLESSMDALTELGLPTDYFAPPMVALRHICLTWTIWRSYYCALTELGLPTDYFAPPMVALRHICLTWTIWRSYYFVNIPCELLRKETK